MLPVASLGIGPYNSDMQTRNSAMSQRILISLTAILCTAPIFAANFPDVEQLPSQTALPDPLVMLNGQRVTTKEQWVNERRPELKALFQHYMYGYFPPAPANTRFNLLYGKANFFDGKATLREYAIEFGPNHAGRVNLLVIIPNKRQKPAPVFLGMNFCGNHTVVADPGIALPKAWMPKSCRGCTNNQATDAGRGTQVETWAIEQSIDRGYAFATFYMGDLDPDKNDFSDGVHALYFKPGQTNRNAQDWGSIAAWAWGFSRCVDYLVTREDLDPARIAAVGHSRNGKASLLAAAFDERISLVIPLQAGCGGTAPSRGKIGESVKQINNAFPHWFNDEFKKFNEQPDRLPFDQHCLIALVAPRAVLLANATEDTWANPKGQFEMLQAAEPVYRLLDAGSLDAKEMPETGKLIASKLGYYIRPGKHSMTTPDWQVFLDYADAQWGKP